MREIQKLAVRLMLFTLVAGLLLALTNALTKEPIARQTAEAVNASRQAVLPKARTFSAVLEQPASEYPDLDAVYRGETNGKLMGYAFVLSPRGYKGDIEMTLGVNADGAVTKMIVTSQSETANLGNRVAQRPFLSQFFGIAADPDALYDEVDTITGATVSSTAVRNAVEQALRYGRQELGIQGKPDDRLRKQKDPTEEDVRRMAMLEGSVGVQEVDSYEQIGYKAISKVYHIDTMDGYGCVIEMDTACTEPIQLRVAIAANGTIARVAVTQQDEPGAGEKIAEEAFLSQFAGISTEAFSAERMTRIPDARSASEAVIQAVADAARYYEQVMAHVRLEAD